MLLGCALCFLFDAAFVALFVANIYFIKKFVLNALCYILYIHVHRSSYLIFFMIRTYELITLVFAFALIFNF